MKPKLPEANMSILHIILLYTSNVALENHRVKNFSSMQIVRYVTSKRSAYGMPLVPLADFLDVTYVTILIYGFKISMLLKHNLLLVSTPITCHLNIFVF